MDLSRYEQTKFALADLLRTLPWTSHRAERLRALFGRLAEDRFNLVVVGRFSRGKSSLMNAILGADWLPTGIVPLTSVVTAVAHGEAESVILHHEHTSLVTDITLAELSAYITERGNPGNRQRISVAEVRLPSEILRRGFHFVDTPGLGSSIAENTRTTEAFLPEADALLLVTSFDSPLSEEERAVLEAAHRSGRRVFVAVNKQDGAAPAERQEVLNHLETQLSQVFGAHAPIAFPVSARDALAARQAGDAAGVSHSGLPALETALVAFLVDDKRRDFLRAMCDRVGALLAEDLAASAALEQLERLRAEFGAATRTMPAQVTPSGAGTAAGCAICAQVEASVFDFLADLQARLRRDARLRQDLAERGGLCGPHAWQFASLAAPREVCTGFAAVLDAQGMVLLDLAAASPSASEASASVSRLLDDRRCPACETAAESERRAVALASEACIAGRQESLLPCLPHLAGLLSGLPGGAVRGALEHHAARLERLSEDAQRFALRQDASRTDLGDRADRDIGTRVMRALVGHPDALAGTTRDPRQA